MPPRSRGPYQIRRQRPRKRVSQDSITYEIPLVGPYETLAAQEPAIGSPFSGYPATFVVIGATLEDTGGGTGRMVVTIEAATPGQPVSSNDASLAEAVYESDYSSEGLPIEMHPKCGYLKPDRFYYEYPGRAISPRNLAREETEIASDGQAVYTQRTWDDWQVLDEDDYEQRSGGWTLAEYKKLREAGVDTFNHPFPYCTATTYHRFRPSSGQGINIVSTPPAACSPPTGYVYVKEGDRVTKSGRVFTRVQQWRGHVKGLLTDLLYPNT